MKESSNPIRFVKRSEALKKGAAPATVVSQPQPKTLKERAVSVLSLDTDAVNQKAQELRDPVKYRAVLRKEKRPKFADHPDFGAFFLAMPLVWHQYSNNSDAEKVKSEGRQNIKIFVRNADGIVPNSPTAEIKPGDQLGDLLNRDDLTIDPVLNEYLKQNLNQTVVEGLIGYSTHLFQGYMTLNEQVNIIVAPNSHHLRITVTFDLKDPTDNAKPVEKGSYTLLVQNNNPSGAMDMKNVSVTLTNYHYKIQDADVLLAVSESGGKMVKQIKKIQDTSETTFFSSPEKKRGYFKAEPTKIAQKIPPKITPEDEEKAKKLLGAYDRVSRNIQSGKK